MNDFIATGTLHSIKLLFQKTVDRNVIIDPFSCLIKLSLLRFLDNGTKISIYQNSIHFNSPSYIQGFIRFIYGDNREHLHNLYLPIQKCVEWFWDDNSEDMKYMFNNSVIGLKMLKYAYTEYATIQHTIDYFIIIIMQKNSHLITKMGFTVLDIERITNEKITNEKITNEKIECEGNSTNNIKQTLINNANNTTKNKNNKNGNNGNTENIENTNTINPKNIRDSILLTKISENDKIKDIQNKDIHHKDIHKFLFELWNQREINIIINLYKEMESKQKGFERDNIYSNIMSYCSMKESKLYKYIENNSSIL